jgi:hypothetical protein
MRRTKTALSRPLSAIFKQRLPAHTLSLLARSESAARKRRYRASLATTKNKDYSKKNKRHG